MILSVAIKMLLFISAASAQSSEYDFIIVGAGTAGCALANRLSENSNWRVLLLEAGGEPAPKYQVDIPMFAQDLSLTDLNWGYKLEPQDNFGLAMNNKTVQAPRGKGIGGSSLINYMINARGMKYDYDNWQKIGNSGWSYDEVLPYFKKLENSLIIGDDYAYRGHSGPVYTSYVSFQTPSLKYFLQAVQEKGYPYIDYNGKSTFGVSLIQSTTKDGTRWSAENAYIRPIRNVRKNLFVSSNSRVLKILIDPSSKKTYGVEYLENSQTKTATITKEVILSAGAYNSPQILMLSGIGPSDQLKRFNITVLKDSPVGQTLYDHITFLGMLYRSNQAGSVIGQYDLLHPMVIMDYLIRKTGFMTTIGGLEAIVFLNTNSTSETQRPDIELIYTGSSLQSSSASKTMEIFNFNPDIYQSVWGQRVGQPIFTIMPTLLHPRSKGKVMLRSANPMDAPLIYGNYFSDSGQKDKYVLLKAIREIQRIAISPAYKDFGAEAVKYELPGCKTYPFDSDKFWYCAMEYMTISLYHPSTTCKMGPIGDKEAVVDNKLKVYGVKKLRVIDASIMPSTISGHLNVPTFMVAEKGADLIKEEWQNK